MKNHTPDFRKWIEAGYRDYGNDPWFFIRELAQNSRDAGAASINVKTTLTPNDEEILIFEDDGCGMSYDHAVRFLFRLYASSKSKEKYAAGLFGIGFWTVLKFNPVKILIESWFKGKSWGIEVDTAADLNTNRIPGELSKKGTRITLIRRAQEVSEHEFQKRVGDALVRYCSYLRRNSRKSERLPVYFAGENISGPMKLPGPISSTFKNAWVEGAVGLGSKSEVTLYARGLPVWQGTSLEELSHVPPSPSPSQKLPDDSRIGEGLAPVFLLNGSQLEVNISRKRVIDNRKLQLVRQTAEKELARLVETAVDCVSPRTFLQRFSDRIKRSSNPFFRHFLKILILSLLIIIPLEYFLIRNFYSGSNAQKIETVFSFQVDKPYYSGATVPESKSVTPPNLVYSPPRDTWFKLFSASDYRVSSGFLRDNDEEELTVNPLQACPEGGMTVEINLRESGRLFLPLPGGHIVEPGSIFINGVSAGPIHYYPGGEAVISVPLKGKLRYRCCPVSWEEVAPLSPERQKQLTRLPKNLTLPITLEEVLRAFSEFSDERKVDTALKMTVDLLNYDDSAETAGQYAKRSKQSDWFQKVIAIGSGDCDILNGVTTLFLRRMGVPARLVIGLVGRDGKVMPQLHAWTEYYSDGKWQIVDATGYTFGDQEIPNEPASPAPEAAVQGRNVSASQSPSNSVESKRKKTVKLPLQLILYVLAAALLLLVLAFFWMVFRSRVSKRSFQPGEFRQVEEDLAGMVLHELLHPGAWDRKGGIRDYKILPTINRNIGPVSLRHALMLGSKSKLFTCNPNSFNGNHFLVDYLKQATVPILDSSNSAFAPIINILPGAVYLEQIFDLRAVMPDESTADPLNSLIAGVNKLLQSINPEIPLCVMAPGFSSGEFYDVDLSSLPSFTGWGIPNRFIVIDPDGERIMELVALFKINRELAQFRLLRTLLKESGIIPVPKEEILETVSRQFLDNSGR